MWSPGSLSTAYECTNQSNFAETYLLLEPHTCSVSDGNREADTTVYTKLLQIENRTGSGLYSDAR